MTDIELAKKSLPGHSIALCSGGKVVTDDRRGIAMLLSLVDEGRDLRGFSAADKIVGKAAAMLFVKLGAEYVWADVVSESGLDFLTAHGICCEHGLLTKRIINREGTGQCPMEAAVEDTDDVELGITLLRKKLMILQKKSDKNDENIS